MSFNPTSGHILVVDDDQNICDLLQINLRSEGYDVEIEHTADNVTPQRLEEVRLVIVDAMKQPFSGMDLVFEIKDNPRTEHIAVILYSDIKSERMTIDALDAGADDYIVKPFSLRELVARVKTVLRRHSYVPRQGSLLTFMTMTLDPLAQTVKIDGNMIQLTKTEYSILLLLMKNIDTYVSRMDILQTVWPDESASTNERIVDTNISRLRKKLGDLSSHIISRTGHGYMLSKTL